MHNHDFNTESGARSARAEINNAILIHSSTLIPKTKKHTHQQQRKDQK